MMEWFCFEDKLYAGDWRVEGRDYGNDGRVYIAIFSGSRSRPAFTRDETLMASGALDALRINAHDLVGRDRETAIRTNGIE
jgi:hypothetical protein